MTKAELLQRLADVPDDFEFCLSKYMILKTDEDGNAEELAFVADEPIIGIAISNESKEIRFVRDGSNLDLAVKVGDELTLLDGSTHDTSGGA